MSHCANDFCKTKDTCLRWKAHLELLQSKPLGMYYSYINHNDGKKNTGDDSCEFYLTILKSSEI